jgi:hypothetical protein
MFESELFPIEQVKPEEVHFQALRFQRSIASYLSDETGNTVSTPPLTLGRFNPMRLVAERRWRRDEVGRQRWEARGLDAMGIASNITLRQGNLDHAYIYKSHGMTAALLVLSVTGEGVEIAWLASHPAVTGAGTMMVEKAVNVSESLNFGGSVQLTSLSHASSEFYRSLHFDFQNAAMKLTPSEKPLWSKNQGVWRFRGRG